LAISPEFTLPVVVGFLTGHSGGVVELFRV